MNRLQYAIGIYNEAIISYPMFIESTQKTI